MEIFGHARGTWCAFAALLFILGATCSASAQVSPDWTTNDAYQCWTGWNNTFLTNTPSGGEVFFNVGGLWEEFETLEVVEDAYDYATAYYQNPNLSNYTNEINSICEGITNLFPREWQTIATNDTAPNDDLMWGVTAYARALTLPATPTG